MRERADIVEIVKQYVTLKPAGGGAFKGLCPFHDEKSPSFQVRPGRGYFCFGCERGWRRHLLPHEARRADLPGDRRVPRRQDRRPAALHRGRRPDRAASRRGHPAAADRGAPGRAGLLRRAPRVARRRGGSSVPRRARLRPGGRRHVRPRLRPARRRRALQAPAPEAVHRRRARDRRSGRREPARPLRPVPRSAAVADPGDLGRDDRLRCPADLRRRPDRGEVPQHPRVADLQEEPRALRRRPRAPRDREDVPGGHRRGLHRRDGLPPRRRRHRGRHLWHRVRRGPRAGAASAAPRRGLPRRDHLHLRRRRGRPEGRAACLRR